MQNSAENFAFQAEHQQISAREPDQNSVRLGEQTLKSVSGPMLESKILPRTLFSKQNINRLLQDNPTRIL